MEQITFDNFEDKVFILVIDGLLRILRIPAVLLASYSVFAASVTIEFLSATLEPHLSQVKCHKYIFLVE